MRWLTPDSRNIAGFSISKLFCLLYLKLGYHSAKNIILASRTYFSVMFCYLILKSALLLQTKMNPLKTYVPFVDDLNALCQSNAYTRDS